MRSPKRPLAVLAVLASFSLVASCGGGDDSTASDSSATSSESSSESSSGAPEGAGVECTYSEDTMSQATKEVDLPPAEATVSGEVPVTISTSIGDLSATLDADAAPCTVNSFVSLAEQQYFDDTTCHRLTTPDAGISVLQCGDPSGTGSGGPGYQFPDETEQTDGYPAGTLAMANAGPDTNGSQFFIVYGDTPLPNDYTVFGSIDQASTDRVAKVAADGVQGGGPDGPPATPVDITSVSVD